MDNAIQPFDSLVKVLLVGDSSVGKSSLLLRFTTDKFEASTNPTIGVDFRTKYVTQQGKRLKLTIWDTAGQERFRTLTSSYYRGAHAVIFVYDVTRRETFDSLGEIWMQEVDMYSTIENAIKMVVANKVDRDTDREVTTEEGQNFARSHGSLFVETSAKADVAVTQAFEELVLKVLETPHLLTDAGNSRLHVGAGIQQPSSGCCGG
jgi:Ras-related protein Rab-18